MKQYGTWYTHCILGQYWCVKRSWVDDNTRCRGQEYVRNENGTIKLFDTKEQARKAIP